MNILDNNRLDSLLFSQVMSDIIKSKQYTLWRHDKATEAVDRVWYKTKDVEFNEQQSFILMKAMLNHIPEKLLLTVEIWTDGNGNTYPKHFIQIPYE